MEKLLEILRQHKDCVSYTFSFGQPETLTIKFKDDSVLELCEYKKCKTDEKQKLLKHTK